MTVKHWMKLRGKQANISRVSIYDFLFRVLSCEITPLKQVLSFYGYWLFLYCCIFIDKFILTQQISEIHFARLYYVSYILANKRQMQLSIIIVLEQ